MLTRYGTDNIIIMLVVGAILGIIGGYFVRHWWAWPILGAGVLLVLFTLWFFRDPERIIPPEAISDRSTVISPADGRIVEIIEEDENDYMHTRCIRISIFLSPLDVHVNRCPVSGKVEFYKYNPGNYLVAYHPKSSELNEQSKIGVMTDYGRVLFKQIVGIVARRLVCEIKTGDSIKIGEKFGMMKFGSRMDIKVATNTDIKVKIGDKVTAGRTIIAKLRKSSASNQ